MSAAPACALACLADRCLSLSAHRDSHLLIGSLGAPRLGYTVPPGSWGIQATLILGRGSRDSPHRRTPVLPLTITA